MPGFSNRVLMLTAGALFATSACSSNSTVPTGVPGVSAPSARSVVPNDTSSILKKLTKDVEIGSTVDPKNGDMGPRAISLARGTIGKLKQGDALVCNFEDSAGTAGKGTTIEVLAPDPNSKPATFTQSSDIEGCDGDAVASVNDIYAAGLVSGLVARFDPTGTLAKTYGSPIQAPFADADAFCGLPYAPEDIYVADSKSGSILKLAFVPVSSGKPELIQAITGFGTNNGSGWSVLGPSGLQYDSQRTGSRCNDTLYIVDGVDNTVVAVSNAHNLLEKDEIVVKSGGKKFKCAHPKYTCATLVYSGSPLDAPVASALLPNGNLIVANTQGGNTLVELTPTGKILDTKVIDNSPTAHIFGLQATGTSDSNTALFYTDTGTNTLQELEQ